MVNREIDGTEAPTTRRVLRSDTDTVSLQLSDGNSPEDLSFYDQLQLPSGDNKITSQRRFGFNIFNGGTEVGYNSLRVKSSGVGYTLSLVYGNHRRKNYAARGRALLIDFAFGQLDLKALYCIVDVNNIASIKSVEKSDFTFGWEHDSIRTYVLFNPKKPNPPAR